MSPTLASALPGQDDEEDVGGQADEAVMAETSSSQEPIAFYDIRNHGGNGPDPRLWEGEGDAVDMWREYKVTEVSVLGSTSC